MRMESDSIVDDSMHIALEHLWEKYHAAFEVDDTTQTHELGRILDRGMVWAENEAGMTDILVTGINPSFRTGDAAGSFVFRYRDVQQDSYYLEIRKTFFDDRLHAKAGYLDLFAVRETVQNRLSKFIKHPVGLSFIAEHLAITQQEIERLHPRLIIVKNKGSWMFWGLQATRIEDRRTNVWMGYTFETIPEFGNEIPYGVVRRITGMQDDPDRVGKTISRTNLVGTIVLFTNHLRYMKREFRPTPEFVSQLYDMASTR